MRYPGSPNTHASTADWNRIRLAFLAPTATTTLNPAAAAKARALRELGPDGARPDRHDQPAQRRAVDPADAACGGAAGTDDRDEAKLRRDPRSEA